MQNKKTSRPRKSVPIRKLNNAGMTLVEMLVTFILLGIFMVAATRVISYTIGIYYTARGTSYGYEVSNMLTNKIVGQLENASTGNSFIIKNAAGEDEPNSLPIIKQGTADENGNRLDQLKFVDGTGSVVTISTNSVPGMDGATNHYLVIHYDETASHKEQNRPEGSDPGYAAVDWMFDTNAYMGYSVKNLAFTPAGSDYSDNVVRMDLTLHSPKYGDFTSYYYIKCFNVDKVQVGNY